MRRISLAVLVLAMSTGAGLLFTEQLTSQPPPTSDFTHFESAHTHPSALSPSGDRLFVVNTPDMRVSVFDLTTGMPVLVQEIPVGLEPISLAARDENELWVVNHLGDNISIVDVAAGNVVQTLRVGDEPTDVLFAGTGADERAFVCVSQEDAIKVFDPDDLAAPPESIAVHGSDPRALAVNPSGDRVYVTILESGNQTSIVHFQEVLAGGGPPAPNPAQTEPEPAPNVGLIVRFDGTAWRDEEGTSWNAYTPHRMADNDVITIDANSRTILGTTKSVGTINFNAAYNPSNDLLYVTNTDGRNHVRFEPNLRGDFQRNRVTRLDPVSGTVVEATHLNPHINYTVAPGPQNEIDQSLAIPTDIAFAPNGAKGYVAAMGSDAVGVIDAAGTVTNRIAVGGGPTGITLDPDRNRMYVVNRFDNTVSVVDLVGETAIATVDIGRSGFDPTPEEVRLGRRFLYDAKSTSAHGDVACASCHVFGNFDQLAWDLGDPTGSFVSTSDPEFPSGQIDPLLEGFHPMKGPMMTQSLRGLEGVAPFHWRADRIQFDRFNGAFVSLLGNDRELFPSEMAQFEAFVMSMRYPPNPNQNLDRSFPDPPTGPSAQRGLQTFVQTPLDGPFTCEQCHSFPAGTNGQMVNDQALQEDQDLIVPHLRNLYEKIGYTDEVGAENKLGFGFTHDGVSDNLFNFLSLPVFQFANDDQKRDVEAFLLAFDTGTAPLVGYQVTVDGDNKNDADVVQALNTMSLAAGSSGIDLIAKGVVGGVERGYAMTNAGVIVSDRSSEDILTLSELRALATNGGEITFTGVPLGAGERAGIDRDRDGWLDRDEIDVGTDPADPASFPGAVAVAPTPAPSVRFAGAFPNPFHATTEMRFTLPVRGAARLAIYDVRGRELRVLVDETLPAGTHGIDFDGTDRHGRTLSTGVYFARLETQGRSLQRQIVMIR